MAGFGIEQHGDLETIRATSLKAKEFVHYATELQRTECCVDELWVSTKCGESDEEKARGNSQKSGRKAPGIGCLDKAESPTGPGLWFMDFSSAAADFFPTGQGTTSSATPSCR